MKENQKKAINLLETALEKAKSESADIPAIMGELFEETALETKSVLEEFLAENIEIFIGETIYSIENHGSKYDNPEVYNYENETVYKDKLAKDFADNSNCVLNNYGTAFNCDTAFQLYQLEKQNKPIYNKVKDEIEKEYREREIPNNDSDLKFEILMKKVSENFMKETKEKRKMNVDESIKLLEKAKEEIKEGKDISEVFGDLNETFAIKQKNTLEEYVGDDISFAIKDIIIDIDNFEIETSSINKNELAFEIIKRSNDHSTLNRDFDFELYQMKKQNTKLYKESKIQYEDDNSQNNFELLIEKAVDNFVNESINDFFSNDKKELNKSDLKEFSNYINEKLGKEKEYTMIEILQDKKEFIEKKDKNKQDFEY